MTYAAKCEMIEHYLRTQFPGADIENGQVDADRGFRVSDVDGKRYYLKVGRDFIEDQSPFELLGTLKGMEIGAILRRNASLGVLLSDKTGPTTYELS